MMPNMINAFAAAFGDSRAASSLHVVVVALVTLGAILTLQTRPIAPRFPATE